MSSNSIIRQSRFPGLLLVLGLLPFLFGTVYSAPTTWNHESFEDFSEGTYGNTGHNLYTSRDGRMQTIRRFDINQNNHLDLVFNSTHDWYHHLPAALVSFEQGKRIPDISNVDIAGSSRVIVRDLNRNGHLDLLFHPNRQNLQHPRNFLSIAWGGEDGWPNDRINRLLPVNRSTSIAVADLNQNGWPDIITLNSEAWLPGHPDGKIIRVFWGGPDGYHVFRYLDFGVPDALELASGDFDNNGFEDLAVLSMDGTLRVFWSDSGLGEPTGSVTAHYLSVGSTAIEPSTDKAEKTATPSGTLFRLSEETTTGSMRINRAGGVQSGSDIQTMTTADLAGTGEPSLVFGTRSGQIMQVSFSGRAMDAIKTIEAYPASQITVGDLDGDGRPDLILTDLNLGQAMGGEAVGAVGNYESSLHILWGSENGFSRENTKSMAIAEAIATAVGDFDGDGTPDLAIAVHQGSENMDAESLIFFGRGNRSFAQESARIATKGAMHPSIIPGLGSQPDRVLFNNSLQGTLGEAIPLFIYWGDQDGFSEDRLWKLPFRAGYKSLAADLKGDGHVDLIVVNSGHGLQAGEFDPEAGAHIYWGGETGETPGPNRFDTARRVILNEDNLGASNVADLNKDGYLDLVLGAFETRTDPHAKLVIYYGSEQGYTRDNRFELENEDRTLGTLIGDFNKNGWLDIVVVAYSSQKVTLYYGSEEGYTKENRQELTLAAPIDVEAADLNGDGWLDLIVGSYWDPVSRHHDAGITIFWGGTEGFQQWNAQWLPGWSPIGVAVADLDGDGHLDIVSPHYHAEMTREDIPSYIYWGGTDGYSPKRRTTLIVDSAHDVQIGDFNGNGLLDLAFSAHSRNAGHLIHSPVYFNDGERFSNPEVQYLPTEGTHFMNVQDMGNLMDRSFTETYDSAVLTWNNRSRTGKIAARAEIPEGAELSFSVRSAVSVDSLGDSEWNSVRGGEFRVNQRDRALQYRAHFHSPNGDRFPILDSVSISIAP